MQSLQRLKRWSALVALVCLLPIGAGGAPAQEKSALTPQSSARIAVLQFQFQPTQLEVKAGTTVTWMNEDDVNHTITSGSPDKQDGRFDARLAGKGASFSFTFAQSGTYNYFCNRHHSMQGQIRVN